MELAKTLGLILTGCVVNNWVLEAIISKKTNPWADPKAGGLLTFLQFAFVALCSAGEAFSFAPGKDGSTVLGLARKPSKVPLRHYAFQTLVFAAMSYLNNLAFAFHISQPLHMVFRSANLVVTFLMGHAFFKKKYTVWQLACVLMLTLGAASATFAEALIGDTAAEAAKRNLAAACTGGDCPTGAAHPPAGLAAAVANASVGAAATAAPVVDGSSTYMLWWAVGVAMLTSVLILQSILANYQEWTSKQFGRAPREAMFYMHTMSLPLFALTLPDLLARASAWSASGATGEVLMAKLATSVLGSVPLLRPALGLVLLPISWVPVMWTYVAINVISQYVCVAGVYRLTSFADPLTVNVTLTVRKFVSLLLSIWLFGNTFTLPHWVGACLVFGGAMWYSRLPTAAAPSAGGAAGGAGVGGPAPGSPSPAATVSVAGPATRSATSSKARAAALARLDEDTRSIRNRGAGGSGVGGGAGGLGADVEAGHTKSL